LEMQEKDSSTKEKYYFPQIRYSTVDSMRKAVMYKARTVLERLTINHQQQSNPGKTMLYRR